MGVPGLNAAQSEAVLAPTGPLLVLAGAGTGKTRVVITRIAQLVRRGTRPSRILAVTFTNKAAREMLARAAAMLGGRGRKPGRTDEPSERPEISTIHSLCVRILRRHAAKLGYPERFAIIDRGEQESAARAALKAIKVADTVLSPSDLIDRVSRWKSRAIRPADASTSIGADADDSGRLQPSATVVTKRPSRPPVRLILMIFCSWLTSFFPATMRFGGPRRVDSTTC